MPLQFDPKYLADAGERKNIRAIKDNSYMLIQAGPGQRLLDIGCGPGIDAFHLGDMAGPSGEVWGIDSDPKMVAIANETKSQRKADYIHFKSELSSALSFDDNYFDACRCERVLQHLSVSEGLKTFQEAVRVTKAGGPVLFIDTDWASLSIHFSEPVTERLINNLCAFAMVNGFAARAMPELFHIYGLRDINWEVIPLRLAYPELTKLIAPIMDKAVFRGAIGSAAWAEALQELKNLQDRNSFYATLNMVMCYGTKANG